MERSRGVNSFVQSIEHYYDASNLLIDGDLHDYVRLRKAL